jgi:hypothetical protein
MVVISLNSSAKAYRNGVMWRHRLGYQSKLLALANVSANAANESGLAWLSIESVAFENG